MTPEAAADRLRAARLTRRTLEPFTDAEPALDESWAYDVQALDRQLRLADGEELVGVKLGLTSKAKQERMSVDRPIVGFLTRPMLVSRDEVATSLSRWVQPRTEPEIAFVTSRPIDRAFSEDEAHEYVSTVSMAAEIIDSRWTGYRFRLPDVVADNTSAAGVVLGPQALTLGEIQDLAVLNCRVAVDGRTVHEASGAAILGHPLRALVTLSAHLEGGHESLPAGSLVLAGALTDAVPLKVGARYDLTVESLGTVSVTI
jgi:2-oxo-3-hexenedioate decarboxylase